MAHLEFIFNNIDSSKAEMLIAELSILNFSGFEEFENSLKAYVLESDFNNDAFNNIVQLHQVSFTSSKLEVRNWNEIWESGFEPVALEYLDKQEIFAYIRASFHPAITAAKYDIIITPKMSFGTGHHATTFQMMQQMSTIDFEDKKVIDFGTGTGLLSILAEKMGSNHIIAIDNDDWSINNARENLLINQCNNIELVKADSCNSQEKYADIILANINLNVILANLQSIKKSAKPSSIVLFSGILREDEQKIINELLIEQFTIKQIKHKDNWLLIHTNV